jgi:predicted Holliday junction resolvase-like endonuclease
METGAPNSGVHPDSSGGAMPAQPQMDNIARQLESIEKKLQEATRADSAAKSTARLVTIAIAVVAVGGVLYLLYPLINAYNHSEEYYAALYAEFEETVQPAVARELQQSIEAVGPEVVELARTALIERQEELVAASDREMVTLFESIKTMSEEQLAERVNVVEAGVRERFQQLFPDLADDPERLELVMGNADLVMDQAVSAVVTEQLTPHFESLANIETRLRQFPIPPRLKELDDVGLNDEFNRALAEYAIIVIRDLFLQGVESKATAAAVAEGGG